MEPWWCPRHPIECVGALHHGTSCRYLRILWRQTYNYSPPVYSHRNCHGKLLSTKYNTEIIPVHKQDILPHPVQLLCSRPTSCSLHVYSDTSWVTSAWVGQLWWLRMDVGEVVCYAQDVHNELWSHTDWSIVVCGVNGIPGVGLGGCLSFLGKTTCSIKLSLYKFQDARISAINVVCVCVCVCNQQQIIS
jgi:hypothetical protein